MEYPEFINRVDSFKGKAKAILTNEIYDYSEMIFSSNNRRIFLNYTLNNAITKLLIEVRPTIANQEPEILDQAFYTQQLENMINLCKYLLKLQLNSFIIDSLPEEGIWYATIELSKSKIDNKFFGTLEIDKKEI